MTRIKFLLPFLLFAIMITVAAFRQSENTTKNAVHDNSKARDPYAYYFQYAGPQPGLYADFINPNNYVILSGDPTFELCEYGSEALCAIICERYWSGFGWKPDFNAAPYTGSTKQQLYDYSQTGLAGMTLFLKDL